MQFEPGELAAIRTNARTADAERDRRERDARAESARADALAAVRKRAAVSTREPAPPASNPSPPAPAPHRRAPRPEWHGGDHPWSFYMTPADPTERDPK